MSENSKAGPQLVFVGTMPVANATTIGPIKHWPIGAFDPCPHTGMAIIERGESATGLWWRTVDGSFHIGYQIGDHTTAHTMQSKAIQAALRDLRVYTKAHADLEAGRPWQEVFTEIGFNERRSYEFWEAYMVRRIMNNLRAAELEAAQPVTAQDAAQLPKIADLDAIRRDARAQALREAAALCVSLRKETDRPDAESVGCMDCASAILARADSIQPAPLPTDCGSTGARAECPEQALADKILAELVRARTKFPGKNVTFAALIEEVGELATATFEESAERVEKEAVHVAVMAMRMALDGDHCFDAWRSEKGLDALDPTARAQQANEARNG